MLPFWPSFLDLKDKKKTFSSDLRLDLAVFVRVLTCKDFLRRSRWTTARSRHFDGHSGVGGDAAEAVVVLPHFGADGSIRCDDLRRI